MKDKYLAKRAELIAQAQGFLNDGKTAEAKEVRMQIEKLDADYEDAAKELANMNALAKPPFVADFGAKAMPATGAPIDTTAAPTAATPADIYKNAFAKNLMGLALDAQETAELEIVNAKFRNQATVSGNQILVPESVRAQIWQEIGKLHPIVADTFMTFVQGDITIIKEADEGTDADWYDEGKKVTDSDVAFGELTLQGCELAKCIPISWKLKKMSIQDFLAYVQRKLAEKMGTALAAGLVSGKGKPGVGDTFKAQPFGVLTRLDAEAGTPQIVEYATEIEYENITDLMSRIQSGYMSGCALYAKNTTIWNSLANMVNAMGVPIFIPDVTSGGVGRMFGVTVKEEDAVPAGGVMLANMGAGYVANANENITMYQEDDMKARTTSYMGYAIIDGDVLTTKAFAYLKKA